MRLVDRSRPDRVKRQLSAEEAAAVRRFCGAGQNVHAADAELVAAVLEEMHDGRQVRQWLECDCRDAGSAQPRLTARVREEGPRHFVRMHAYGEHRCALASFRAVPDDEPGTDDDDAPPGTHNPLRPISGALDFLDNRHDGIAGPRNGNTPGGGPERKGRRLPRLGRIMYTLLDGAGFSSVYGDELTSGHSSWDRLNAFAVGEAMNASLTLAHVLHTKPWLDVSVTMTEIDALPWPDSKERSALLLFVADSIEDGAAVKQTRYGKRLVTPEEGIRAGGRDRDLTQPPYWVLAVIDRDREGKERFREAFVQHAYSTRQPVPLDSRYERRTLDCLLRVIEWVKNRGVDVTLTKPLFDREVKQLDGPSLWCRPDFELTFRSVTAVGDARRLHRVVIETMGADEPEYLERKSRTHEIMKRRGILIEHRVSDDTGQGERDDALFRRVGAKILDLAGL